MIAIFVWTFSDLIRLFILGAFAATVIIAAICWMVQSAYIRVRRLIKRKFGR